MRPVTTMTVALVLSLMLGLAPPDRPTAAQEAPGEGSAPAADVPEPGSVVATNTLVGPGTFPAWSCPTGRNRVEPVGEGYILKVTGPCAAGEPAAIMGVKINDIIFPDGEVRLEVKVVSGHERASFILGFRDQGEPAIISPQHYAAILMPGQGWAFLLRSEATLVSRQDLAATLASDDWNSLAVRARGPDLWFFANDQLVAHATDPSFDNGRLFLSLRRIGDPNDTAESAAVIRNLRVSRLATGDPARAPAIGR